MQEAKARVIKVHPDVHRGCRVAACLLAAQQIKRHIAGCGQLVNIFIQLCMVQLQGVIGKAHLHRQGVKADAFHRTVKKFQPCRALRVIKAARQINGHVNFAADSQVVIQQRRYNRRVGIISARFQA